MSGNSRIDVGEITQSSTKGSAMESVLSESLNNPTPKKTKKK